MLLELVPVEARVLERSILRAYAFRARFILQRISDSTHVYPRFRRIRFLQNTEEVGDTKTRFSLHVPREEFIILQKLFCYFIKLCTDNVCYTLKHLLLYFISLKYIFFQKVLFCAFFGQSLGTPIANVWLSPLGALTPLRQFHIQDGSGSYHYSFTSPHHAKSESSLNGITQGGKFYYVAKSYVENSQIHSQATFLAGDS